MPPSDQTLTPRGRALPTRFTEQAGEVVYVLRHGARPLGILWAVYAGVWFLAALMDAMGTVLLWSTLLVVPIQNAMVVVAADVLQGRAPRIAGSLWIGLRRTPRVLVAWLPVALLSAVGLVLLVVPGLVVLVMFQALEAVAVLEHRSWLAPLSRSRALLRGQLGAAVGLYLIGCVGWLPMMVLMAAEVVMTLEQGHGHDGTVWFFLVLGGLACIGLSVLVGQLTQVVLWRRGLSIEGQTPAAVRAPEG